MLYHLIKYKMAMTAKMGNYFFNLASASVEITSLGKSNVALAFYQEKYQKLG